MKAHALCGHCPFRKDRKGYLRPSRGEEIAESLRGDLMFHCHMTVDYGVWGDDEGEGVVTQDSTWCNGALALMKNEDDLRGNVCSRVGIWTGEIIEGELDTDATFASYDEWIEHLKESEL